MLYGAEFSYNILAFEILNGLYLVVATDRPAPMSCHCHDNFNCKHLDCSGSIDRGSDIEKSSLPV